MPGKGSKSSNKKKATARGRAAEKSASGGRREASGAGRTDRTPDTGMAQPSPTGRHNI